MRFRELLELGKRGIVKAGAIAATASAIISDILEPACKATLICLCIACAVAILIWLVHALGSVIPKLGEFNDRLAKKTEGAWYLPVFASAILACFVFTAMYAFNHDDPDGLLAAHSSAIRKLQAQMGLMKANLAEIRENTGEAAHAMAQTAAALEEGSLGAKEISEQIGKIVNPGDARRILAMRGRRMDAASFANSIYQGDLADASMFFKAGMKGNTATARGERPVYRAVLENMPKSRDIAAAALTAGQLSREERVEPVELQGYAEGAIRQFGQWLDNDTGFFDHFMPKLEQDLKKLNIGDCIAFGEFLPGKESLELIYDGKLDMNSGIALREKIAKAYTEYLNNTEKKVAESLKELEAEMEYIRICYQCREPSVKISEIPEIDQFPEYRSHHLVTFGSSWGDTCQGAELDESGKCPDNSERVKDYSDAYQNRKREIAERMNSYDIPGIRHRLEAYKNGTKAIRLAQGENTDWTNEMRAYSEYVPAGMGRYRKFGQRPDLSGKEGRAYIPPLPQGQIRIYGPLNSVGVHDDYDTASRKGQQWTNSEYGRLGKEADSPDEAGSAWFYADIDAKSGKVVSCRFYACGAENRFEDSEIVDLVKENPKNPGYILKNRFVLTFGDPGFEKEKNIVWASAVISGETNLLKARNGQKVRVNYFSGDREINRFVNMEYGKQDGHDTPHEKIMNFDVPWDYGYGEATIERND